jgi:hypothetical protein
MVLFGQPLSCPSGLTSSGSQKLGSHIREVSSHNIPNVFSFSNFHLFWVSVMLSHNLSH